MADGTPCTRELLARRNGCAIERCSCGHLHVTIGPVTIRVDDGMLAELQDAVDVAQARLRPVVGAPLFRRRGEEPAA